MLKNQEILKWQSPFKPEDLIINKGELSFALALVPVTPDLCLLISASSPNQPKELDYYLPTEISHTQVLRWDTRTEGDKDYLLYIDNRGTCFQIKLSKHFRLTQEVTAYPPLIAGTLAVNRTKHVESAMALYRQYLEDVGLTFAGEFRIDDIPF